VTAAATGGRRRRRASAAGPDLSRTTASELATAAALYAALTILFNYPLSIHPGSTLFGDNPDTHLYVYTLAWDAHAFVHNPLGIFDANFYYPNRLTLAYSENSIGSALFAAPILWATGNRVLALNLTQLLAGVLCGIGAYVLARSVGAGPPGALIAGLIFAFAPTRWVRTGQLYLGTLQWMPLTLASLHEYFGSGTKRYLRWAAAFFTLQAYTSGHAAVFLTLAATVLVAYRLLLGEPFAPLRWVRDLGVTGALLLAPTALLYWPYHLVQVEMGLRRTLEDWAPTWQSFIASPTHVQQWLLSLVPSLRVNELASAYLFPGFLPLMFAAAAVALRDRLAVEHDRTAAPARWTSWVIAALGAIAIGGAAIAVIVATSGPIRWRLSTNLTLSVRDVVRPLAVAAVAVVLRLAAGRRRRGPGVRERLDQIRTWRQSRSSRWRDDPVAFYTVLTMVGIWASIGPPLGIWPAIYWLPGLNFIRVPSRFMLLAILGLAVLAGIGVERLIARVAPRRAALFTAAVALLMTLEFAAFPLPVAAFTVDIPPIDRWLAEQRTPFAVAEFPLTSSVRQHTTYMLHSMAHWQKTIHGFSGFEAPFHTTLYRELRAFPDDLSLLRLRDLRITYIVVHPAYYQAGEWADVEKRLAQFADRLSLEHEEGNGRVYTLKP
jgi:hypothetical protein